MSENVRQGDACFFNLPANGGDEVTSSCPTCRQHTTTKRVLQNPSASAKIGECPGGEADTTTAQRVLIVSTKANCEIAKSAMNHWALDPICCSSLREARALLLDAGASLIFCDAELEDGTYQDLLSTLDKTATRHFVVITSAPDDEKYEEAMQLGAFEVMVSPCRRTDVQWIVIRALQEDRREGEKRISSAEELASGNEK